MRGIAGEFNEAETTFLLKSRRADWRLRSFTARGAEVFGAGHNALGAWLWLAEHGKLGALETPRTFHQEIGRDVLPIVMERSDGRIHGRMRQAPLQLLQPLREVTHLARALGFEVTDEWNAEHDDPGLQPRVHRGPDTGGGLQGHQRRAQLVVGSGRG